MINYIFIALMLSLTNIELNTLSLKYANFNRQRKLGDKIN